MGVPSSCFSRRDASHDVLVDLERSFRKLTSGQGRVVPQKSQGGHVAYHSKRIDKTDTLVLFILKCLYSIASYCQKKFCDLSREFVTSL